MTLLGWMHRKLRSNNDVFKEFNTAGGGACNCISGLASPDADTFSVEYFANDAFAANHLSSAADANDIFTFGGSGLLTIGTLGFAAVTIPQEDNDDNNEVKDEDNDVDVHSSDGTDGEEEDGAVTPTFTFAPVPPMEAMAVEKATGVVEAIAEKDDDTTTEDDLMLVSAELEKVLCGNVASDVPSARVSFTMGVDCPLQGFLFGSPVSSDAEGRPKKRDSGCRRTSLGELFMRTRFADEKVALVAVAESEDGGDGAAGGERENGKAGKRGGGHKMMKKWKVKDEKGAGRDGVPAGNTVNKSKFQKILQIFHRKVYPESTILTRNLAKKNRKRGAPENGGAAAGDPDEPFASQKVRSRKDQRIRGLGCCTNCTFAASPDNGELNGSKSGHWIKTDADYLVLEL